MKDKGIAHIGIGYGKGEEKASEAIKMAVESPLLETTLSGATDVIINFSGDISIFDAQIASEYVQSIAGEDINVIFGAMYNEEMADSCTVTVIATGIVEEVPSNSPVNNMGKINTNFSVKPNNISTAPVRPRPQTPGLNIIQTGGQAQANTPVKPAAGIKPATDLRSNVKEQTLNIPNFLKR
jgi:cell division protein FtsZ